jgi:nucleoside phosphorylase
MDTKQITIIFWDNLQNFSNEDTRVQLGIINNENRRFKDVLRFQSQQEFETILEQLNNDDLVLILCHINFKENYKGYKEFNVFLENSAITNKDAIKYVSSNKEAHKDFIEKNTDKITIYNYSEIKDHISLKNITPYSKKNISNTPIPESLNPEIKSESHEKHYKYAIFTAIYDEFKEVEQLFNWKDSYKTGTSIYKIGVLKGTDKEVVAIFATKSGMVESSILATEMINLFKPEYIFMPGVCGGEESTKFGSVIVANKVFLLGKGKLSDVTENTPEGKKRKTELFYEGKAFNINNVKDKHDNLIDLIVENYENELEVIDIDTELQTIIEPELSKIEAKINEPYKLPNEQIKVQLEPMACSLMVINKEDYFEVKIKATERKTKAVEMESYGVARAAKLANGGKTKFLIFKSVMDKAKLKTDGYKEKAAYTSAQFLKFILENNIL